MQTNTLNREDGEKMFITVQNVEGSTITAGMAVVMAIGTSFNGIGGLRSNSATAANLPGFVGIALNNIPSNGYGLVQNYGFNSNILLSNTATSVTINAGDPLVPAGLAGTLTSAAPTYANGGFRYVLASNVPTVLSAGSAITAAGFIRCI